MPIRSVHDPLRAAFEQHLSLGYALLRNGDRVASMREFEHAHILGQNRTGRHLRSHLAMFRWARQGGDRRELRGQLGRLVGALLFTWLWVPRGNPGSTRVGAFTPMPIPEPLASLLRDAAISTTGSHSERR